MVTTGIHCRPSCPAVTPKRVHVRFFPAAAAAQGAGFHRAADGAPAAVEPPAYAAAGRAG
ncbi:Ada metal-binding domain-containing protein [Streptomyces sioyaensis]|uniref:Ada metal-binding domain-containing protein n=1 Tax=Streptomyces sioyaensis TaxID=67364 RepID=UPI001EEFB267